MPRNKRASYLVSLFTRYTLPIILGFRHAPAFPPLSRFFRVVGRFLPFFAFFPSFGNMFHGKDGGVPCLCVSRPLALSSRPIAVSVACPSRLRGGARWSARLSPPARAGGGCGPRLGRSRARSLSLASVARRRPPGLPRRGAGGAAAHSPCGGSPAAAGRCGACRCPCARLQVLGRWPVPRRWDSPRRCGLLAAS